MDQIDKILRGLQDTMTVMEGLQRRQADRQQEHQQWLEDLNRAWSKHNAAWQRHEAAWQAHQDWLVAHDRAMAEIDVKLDSLIEAVNRFVQGRNGN